MKFKYGCTKIEIDLPDGYFSLTVKDPPFDITKEQFKEQLTKKVPFRKYSSVGIVISDKTRLCGYDLYLPWLTEHLSETGATSDNITFYIAYGTHPKQSEEESLAAYGSTYSNYRFVHHDCTDERSMVTLGKTSSGTEIKILKDILEHDLLILMGAVSHHYFAGYGGGRKLIFPGLAFRNSIYANHKLFIDFGRKRLHPGCQSGSLDANPVAEDLKEIDSMVPSKVIISGILNPQGKVCRFDFGNTYKEFEKTCAIYDSYYKHESNEEFDLVIASSGGYPKDINLIQTHKSIHNAAAFVKNGGDLVLFGECRDGIGNESFLDLFRGTKNKIIEQLAAKYSGNGGTALALMAKTSRINIHFMTSFDRPTCELMNISKIDEKGIRTLVSQNRGSLAVIENASIIFR
ncbi:MAG TPA: nickel-dependent lactate racemase [Bacteroidales bacterium]|nr:nickel-dependent lactate racemase [Bacteroidales bacterium]